MTENSGETAAQSMPPAPDRVPLAPQALQASGCASKEAAPARPGRHALARLAEQLGEVHGGYLRAMEGQQAAFLQSQQDLQRRLLKVADAPGPVRSRPLASDLADSPASGLASGLASGWRSLCRSVPSIASISNVVAGAEGHQVAYAEDSIEAFYLGRPWECFGEPLRLSQCHVRTPALDERAPRCLTGVVLFEAPVIRAEGALPAASLSADPLDRLVEMALQVLAFTAVARGLTLERDGWRFTPISPASLFLAPLPSPATDLVTVHCLGRLTAVAPKALNADLELSIDGVPVLAASKIGISLEVDHPITSHLDLLDGHVETRPFAVKDDVSGDYASLLAAAWGKPSDAFGARYAAFDGERRCPRLPGPPYHFVSRITRIEAEFGKLEVGASIEAEYDVPTDAWYFSENGTRTMPLCVLMELNLQPCGWLAAYSGAALDAAEDLVFRNLDGAGQMTREVTPSVGTLRSRVEVTSYSALGDVVILAFAVECLAGNEEVARFETSFGFFTGEAMKAQVGVAPERPFPDLDGPAAQPVDWVPAQGRLMQLGRVLSCATDGGEAGLGRIVAERPVTPGDWCFQAHFYQDPVQPGSIGIESLLQLLQRLLVEKGNVPLQDSGHFEPIMLDQEFQWRYRGQVTPDHRRVTTEVEILELGVDERGPYAVAEAYLWADDLVIYHLPRFAVRLVGQVSCVRPDEDGPCEWLFDPAEESWVQDHCPSYTIPVMPLTCMVDALAQRACDRFPSHRLVEISDVQLRSWLRCSEPRRLALDCTTDGELSGRTRECSVSLLAWRVADPIELSRFEVVASARIRLEEAWPKAPTFSPRLDEACRSWNPYIDQDVFHGPAFHVVESITEFHAAAMARIDPSLCGVPAGAIQPGILDGTLHAIPYRDLGRWSDACPPGYLLLPMGAEGLRFYGPMPQASKLDAWVQLVGIDVEQRTVRIDVEVAAEGQTWMTISLVGRLFPTGPFQHATGREWQAFFGDRQYVPGLSLSSQEGGVTRLDESLAKQLDWLPGTLERVYQGPADMAALVTMIAVKEHVAARAEVHPATVIWHEDSGTARCSHAPLRRWPLRVSKSQQIVSVESDGEPTLDLVDLLEARRQRTGAPAWPGEDLYFSLCRRFVENLVLEDPDDFAALHGRGVIFLANHQVAVESLLFSTLLSSLNGVTIQTIAKATHRETWVGRMVELCQRYPGHSMDEPILFFRRDDQQAMLEILRGAGERLASNTASLAVHVDGTRSLGCRQPVENVSSVFIDLALRTGAPLVPVHFGGGLPVEPASSRLEFPDQMGAQVFTIGPSIPPDLLETMSLAERRNFVIEKINAVGGSPQLEQPVSPDPAFAEKVLSWRDRLGVSETQAVLISSLEEWPSPDPVIVQVLERLKVAGSSSAPDGRGLDPWGRGLLFYLTEVEGEVHPGGLVPTGCPIKETGP